MTDIAQAQRHRPLLTAVLLAQLAFGLLAMTICLPSMQDWPATFGASQAAVQLTFSAYVATYGGLQLAWGPLSDRHGRRPLLLLGLAIATVGSVVGALAPNLWVLVAARMLQGAGCAAGMVVGRAMVQDLFAGPQRTRVMAFVGMTMGLCPPIATVVGGNLHAALGWQSTFIAMAVLGLVLLAAGWQVLPVTPPAFSSQGWKAMLAGYGRLARVPGFGAYVAMMCSTTATFYTFLAGAPVVLGSYGVRPDRLGWYIMCTPIAYIAGSWLTSRLVQTHSERALMRLGQGSVMAGLLLLLVLGLAGLHTPLAFSLPLVMLGIGHGLLVPPTLAGTVGLVPALAGSAAAVGGLAQQLTGAFGGFAVGLVPHEGPAALAVLMIAWTVLGMVAQARLPSPASGVIPAKAGAREPPQA